MKIAYLLGSLNRGGTETLLLDVFRNAASNKLDAIGIYRKSGVCEQEFKVSGVHMFLLKPGKNIFSYFLKLRTLLKQHKIEIVHAQQPIDALLAYFASIGTGIKVLLTLHGFDYNEKSIGKIIHHFILRRTNLNFYVSNYQKEYYIKKYNLKPEKQKVVYNGISFDKLFAIHRVTLSHPMSKLRQELQIHSETILIGTVGNFVHGRDQFTICRFLKLINDAKLDFHFVFVGKRIDALGERYDNCVAYCKENKFSDKVSFLGVRNDVPQILHEIDAFVYATDHDTFGIAVVEALACGLPVFVNDWDVMSEITENGELATIYKTKDEHDLFRHFSLFLQDKKQYKDKAQVAASVVNQKYSIEKHIENLQAIYNSIS